MNIIEKFNTFTKKYASYSIFNNHKIQTGGAEQTNQTEFERRLKEATDKSTYSGASAELIFNLLKLVYEYVILYSLKIINFFYERLEDELKSFAGDATSTNAEFDKNKRLLKAIEIVIQSPEFQQKWNDFTTILAELIGSMVDKIRQELDGEFGEMMGDISELVYKNTKTAVFGVGLGVLDGVCALPPMIPLCELMIAVGTGSKLTSDTFLTFMRSVTRIANSFSKVFGDTSDKFASVVKETLDMYTTVADLITNASNIGVGAINEATKTVASLTPSSELSELPKSPTLLQSQSGGKNRKNTKSNKKYKKKRKNRNAVSRRRKPRRISS